jgi:dipeptidyl-peptidase-4
MATLRITIALLFLLATAGAQQVKELTLEAIFAEGGLTGRAPETIKWSPDGTRVSFVQRDASGSRGELWYVDAATGKTAVLVNADKLSSLAPPASAIANERERERRTRYAVAGYHWSPDSKHLLFDSRGQLWLFSLETGTAVALTASTSPHGDPKFSPDGSRVAYVRGHNLFVRPVAKGREKRLTKDSDPNILNGEVDWVYAEELGVRSNYFWSPDGRQIVFLQMDETRVPTYPIVDWIPQHPTVDMQKYPKAGDPNPAVRVGVVDSNGSGVKWLKIPGVYPVEKRDGAPWYENQDIYVPRFGWVRDSVAYAQVLNRAQDKLELYFVDVRSNRAQLMLAETSDAWIEMSNDFRVLKSGDRFLWSSWRDGNTHLYLYSFDQGNPTAREATLERQLTRGEYEVFSVGGVDEKSGTVYFAANDGNALERQLFAVKLDGSGLRRVSKDAGTHNATFSPDGTRYMDNFASKLQPPRLAVCSVAGECHGIWESARLDGITLTEPMAVSFQAEDGTTLHGSLLLPPGAERAAPGSIPLLMNPYGGPHGQTVRDNWGGNGFLFAQILARRGIATLQVDNRGMGARGRKFAAALRHNFGEVELKDQLAALDQALAQFPVLDAKRLGWWGWSYGGYMTLYAMTHSDRFRAGVAGAPVTDWLDYDTIYTERYMGLPKENADGYKRSSPVHDAKRLSGHLLIVHGSSDDNVHMQNTVQMVNNLIEAGQPFDLLLYPRKTHGITGTAARVHLYRRIQQHFEEAFGMVE